MHDEMIESIAEQRGYDKGFTGGTLYAHELINEYIQDLKHKRSVLEADGAHRRGVMNEIQTLQKQINALQHAKLTIRKGLYESE